ncbi:MAG: 30S ribosomal protein S20 [bacterium]|nr:MAG: 30S ribosomal protein S20 [bacterium]
MPNHKSAWKRMRQNERRRIKNRAQRSYLRKTVKSFSSLDDAESAKQQFPGAAAVIDKAAKKRIIHKRTAARIKSRLSKRFTSS